MEDLDKLLADIESEGFDTEPSKPVGKREAIEKSITDMGTGFVDTFKLDPAEQSMAFIENAVPRGIREEYDVMKEAGSELKDLYEKNVSDLKGGAKKTVDLIKERTPQNSIYKNILNKISTALGTDDTESSYNSEPTPDEIVTQQLENVFDRNRKKESIGEIIKEVKDDNKFATNVSILQDILGNLKYDTQFKDAITENYYRKSLELQFKSLYVTKQQLEITKSGFDLFKTQLEAIVKNTGLPDLVKLKSSEQLKESIQNRFRDNLTDMFYSKANPLQNMKNNIMGNVGKFISGAKMGFETGNMFLEQANELSKTGMGPSKAEMMGGEAANFARDYLSDSLGKTAEKNDFVRDKLFKAKMAMADPRETLFNMANEQFDKGTKTGRVTSKLLKMVGGITQADRQDFTRVGEYEPDEATIFDYRTKNSIVKVIPSLLSKIYTEVNGIRTGKTGEGLYFDYDTGKIQKESTVKENILRDTAVTFQGAAGGNLDRFTSLLEDSNGEEFTPEAKNHIKGVIVGHLIKNGSMSPEAMLKDDFLEQFDPEFRDLVKDSVSNTIDKGKEELQVLDEFKSSLEGTIGNIPLMDKQIEEYFKNGQIDSLEEMGLVKYDPLRKMYKVDRDRYTDILKESITYEVDNVTSTKKEPIESAILNNSNVTDTPNIDTNKVSKVNSPTVTLPTMPSLVNTPVPVNESNMIQSITPNHDYKLPKIATVNKDSFIDPLTKIYDTSVLKDASVINPNTVSKKLDSIKQNVLAKNSELLDSSIAFKDEIKTDNLTTTVKPIVEEVVKSYENKKINTIKNLVTEETKNMTSVVKSTLNETKDKLDTVTENINIPTIQELLDKDNIDTEAMYTKYQESGAMKTGTNFLSWANTLGYTLMGRKFTKAKQQLNKDNGKNDNIKESIFGKVKNEISDMYTIDPVTGKKKLSIAGVFKKTREWDRKMFKSLPNILGKGMSTAFKSIPMLAGGLGKVVKGGAGIVGDMFGVSKKARSLGKEQVETETVQKDKNTLFSNTLNKVSTSLQEVKDKIKGTKSNEKPKPVFGDKDGDGDRDMGWKDRLSNKIKGAKDKVLNKKDKTKPTKKDGILSSIWGMLKGALPFLGTIATIGGSMLSGIMKIGPAILSLGGLLTSAVGGIAKGAMSAGSWVKGKIFGDKQSVKGKVNAKPKVGKAVKPGKIMSILKSFKTKILKKLGKKAGIKALATLTAKIAARAIPVAGLALLAYDATMIGKYMLVDGLSITSAVSKQILGFDINNDDEAVLDENGNPIKPDEDLSKIDISKSVDEDRQSGINGQIENENKPKDSSFFGGVMDKVKSYANNKDNLVGSMVDKTSNFFKTGSFKATPNKSEVMGIIDKAAERTGVDSNTLKTFAAIESGFDPNAKASTSSASGLFQFIKSTWKAMLKKYGPKYDIDSLTSPYDPMANAIMGAEYIKENTKALKGVRKDVGLTDLYMAHFLGPNGAKELFSARPDEFAAAVLPSAARANKSIFFNKDQTPKTVSEVYNLMQNRLVKKASSYGFKQDTTEQDKVATTVNNVKSAISTGLVSANNPMVTKGQLNTSINNDNVISKPSVGVNSKPMVDSLKTGVITASVNNAKNSNYISEASGESDPASTQTSNVKNRNKQVTKSLVMANNISKQEPSLKMEQHDYKPNFTSIENVLLDSYNVQLGIKESIDTLVEHTINTNKNTKVDKPKIKTSMDLPSPAVSLDKKRYAM